MSQPVELLLNGRVAPGVWQIDTIDEPALALIRRAGWHAMILPPPLDKGDFIDAAHAAAQAPPPSGRNWDALSDRWCDLSWFPAGPIIMVMPWPEDPGPVALIALEIASEAAHWWNSTTVNERRRNLTVLLVTGRGSARRVNVPSLDDAAHAMGAAD